MTAIWDASSMPPQERADALREFLGTEIGPLEVDHKVPPQDIQVRLALSDLGSTGLCSARSSGLIGRRTSKQARDDTPPTLVLALQRSGTGMVLQSGREAVLRPGEFALCDTTLPYTLAFQQGMNTHFYFIPLSEVALPHDALRRICAVSMGERTPMEGLASNHLTRVAEAPELRTGSYAEQLAQPSVELVRALLATHVDHLGLAREPLHESMTGRIVEYMRQHLAEPDLSATRIARAHNISVRYLYVLLERSGISLGDWIRARRLEECRKALAKPTSRAVTIASIARRWGFTDPAHFSRAFRETYGVTPREWRATRAPATSAPR
ncbi:helix-turn-helix domain-containing protein [Salinactinospora qingdaonensis]